MQQSDYYWKVKQYFEAWLKKDGFELKNILADEIYYSECYGPEYVGIKEVKQWFYAWNQVGNVLKWEIKKYIEQNNTIIVEWYFECEYEGNRDGFDGVSWIVFDNEKKICSVKEFQSQKEHYRPYN